MEQCRGASGRVPAQGPAEDQARGSALRAGESRDANRVPRTSGFCGVHAASIELDGNRLGNWHLRLSVRVSRIPVMDDAGDVASEEHTSELQSRQYLGS